MTSIRNLLKQLPFQILFVILLSIFLTPILPQKVVQIFYSMSCVFKDALMLFLPIVTFGYMFASMLKFAKSAPLMIVAILVTVTLSNALSFIIPLFLSEFLMSFLDLSGGITFGAQQETIETLWQLPIPAIWTPKNGMIVGLISGIVLSFAQSPAVSEAGQIIKNRITDVLNLIFIPLLPLFVFGFFTKLQFDGVVIALLSGYGKVLLVTIPIFVVYVDTWFLIINRFDFKATTQYLKDSFGAFVTAFSTMSSIATMPLMLKVSQKHIPQKDYVDFIIPSVINIHMIGDSIIFSTTIIAIFYLFNLPIPPMDMFLTFLGYYLLARFSIAGVPGGSTVIVTPLTVSYLGFTSEMAAVFMTLGILQDCILTTGNVAGNIIYPKLSYDLFGKKILGYKN